MPARIDNTGMEPGTQVVVTGGAYRNLRGIIVSLPTFTLLADGRMEAAYRVAGRHGRVWPTVVLVRWLRPLSAVDLLAERAE